VSQSDKAQRTNSYLSVASSDSCGLAWKLIFRRTDLPPPPDPSNHTQPTYYPSTNSAVTGSTIECPFCLSVVPMRAMKCRYCTSQLTNP
jgi:hypothetical protein